MAERVLTESCPQCGAARLDRAWDCAECGFVLPEDQPEESAKASSPARTASSSKRKIGSRRAPAKPGFLDAFREWIDENLVVAILVVLAMWAATTWLFARFIVDSTDQPRAVEMAYHGFIGRLPPAGFKPGVAGHLVGRHAVLLEHTDGVFLYLYTQRWPAERVDAKELNRMTERILDFFEMEWTEIRKGSVEQDGRTIMARVVQLGGERGPHLYLVPITTEAGEQAMLALMGRPREVRAAAKQVLDQL